IADGTASAGEIAARASRATVIADADLSFIVAKRDSQESVQKLETVAETAEYVVIGGAVGESEKRVYIDRKIRSDLIYQTRVECADPGSRTDRVVEFNIATQIPDYCTGEPDWILPLHTHVVAARFIENVDPRLAKERETQWQRVTHR